MIAAVAWRHGAALLAQDVDLQRMGPIIGIELDQVLPTPLSGHSRSTIVLGWKRG
jgi:hypothetical protein